MWTKKEEGTSYIQKSDLYISLFFTEFYKPR